MLQNLIQMFPFDDNLVKPDVTKYATDQNQRFIREDFEGGNVKET